MRRCLFSILLLCGLIGLPGTAPARVKLVALPDRSDTQINLDNPTATLVEEERTLTLQQGRNQVDFSWKGVEIDADSIRLNVLTQPESVNLLSVSYPPAEAALVWDLSSKEATDVRVRISYLLRNIDQLVAYKMIADKQETEVALKSFSVLRNFSGEDFSESRIQANATRAFEGIDLPHEETLQLLALDLPQVPINKVWTFDAARLPWDPEKVDGNVGIPVSYVIKNSKTSGLGGEALAAGRVRVFQRDGQDGTIFLGEDDIPLTPDGEEMKVYIGDSRDIVVTQRQMKKTKINIRRSGNRIILYDTDEQITATMENFKSEPASLTMIQHIPGEWTMRDCNIKYERKDAGTLEFQVELQPNSTNQLVMDFNRLNVR
ncbi:MAG: hypothetical protein PHP44_13215 [Kiritimatiellae bacterium]|nr:hypothetical protein [Kiritimatiellia bacterium]MDD4737052.1 hypothetical protein [Kiritimatiellia bacterium]